MRGDEEIGGGGDAYERWNSGARLYSDERARTRLTALPTADIRTTLTEC